MGEYKLAALLHNISWKMPTHNPYKLDDGIIFHTYHGSRVEKAYERMCKEASIDGGEPFSCDTYLEVYAQKQRLLGHFGTDECIVSRICNIWAILVGLPVGSVRIIGTDSDFVETYFTEPLYPFLDFHLGLQMDYEVEIFRIDKDIFTNMKKIWNNLGSVVKHNFTGERHLVFNAFIFYFYAWRAFSPDISCIHLCIVLETLFSPQNHGELAHRISYNASSFLGDSVDERKTIYNDIKKFYGLRSSIVHGALPNWDKVHSLIPKVFRYCSAVLKKILLERENIELFNNNKKREELFERYLFS